MATSWTVLIVLALGCLGYVLGRRRAVASAGGDSRRLHSRPIYYGWNIALFTVLPALTVMVIWALAQPLVVSAVVSSHIPAAEREASPTMAGDVQRATGTISRAVSAGAITEPEARTLTTDDAPVLDRMKGAGLPMLAPAPVLEAAKGLRATNAKARIVLTVLGLALAIGGLILSLSRTNPQYRARNIVETVVRGGLILCSLIAIATTIGIVLSLVFESAYFFQMYPWQDFLFGTEWTPSFSGGSKLGMLPLLWGTLYISLIALLVSVPIGLFAAIYLSEYASNRVRTWIKPMIEVLAGIPTIVYGLFALTIVGPLLRDWIARPMGFGDSGSSVLTAGLVMGVMLIPFVSSLSDDIITAVPQSLRDGSLGLGSTRSETIRQVVLPAALPGIVGAVLLAASRAIGETMIVVLGAGAMAQISGNPFEAMTTITVKIVGQLTGDNDFASPETLVAFALGLTLFVITLSLNVVALVIVRKYREQYE